MTNWTIAAVRGFPDDLGTLGPKVEPKPAEKEEKPDPVGIITGADGKMRTNLPENEAANAPPPAPTWPPHMPKPAEPPQTLAELLRRAPKMPPPAEPAAEPDPGAHGFMREPLRVGDKVRVLRELSGSAVGDILTVTDVSVDSDGMFTAGGRRYRDRPSERDIWWERVPAAPVRELKVGDRIRHNNLTGVFKVDRIEGVCVWLDCGAWCHADMEGKTWERVA